MSRKPTQAELRDAITDLCYEQLGSYRHIADGTYPPYAVLANRLGGWLRYTRDEVARIEEWCGATLFRGYWAPESDPEGGEGWQSIHWTRDRDTAVWFATRLLGIRESIGMVPMLATFTPRNVLDILYVPEGGRDEAEVMVRIDRLQAPDAIERLTTK